MLHLRIYNLLPLQFCSVCCMKSDRKFCNYAFLSAVQVYWALHALLYKRFTLHFFWNSAFINFTTISNGNKMKKKKKIIIIEMLTACVFAHFICSLAHPLICPFNWIRVQCKIQYTRNATENLNKTETKERRKKDRTRTKTNYWMPKKGNGRQKHRFYGM